MRRTRTARCARSLRSAAGPTITGPASRSTVSIDAKSEPPIYLTISWYAMLGALDDAYETAGRIVRTFAQTGIVNPLALIPIWLPELRLFRQDRRFEDFTVRLGLLDYWKERGPPDNCELGNGRLIVH